MKALRIALIVLIASTALPAIAAAGADARDRVRVAVEGTTPAGVDRDALLAASEQALRAGVPSADLEVIVRRGAAAGIGPAGVRGLINVTTASARRGLQLDPVLDRIEQGLAKGIPAERIEAASQRLVEKLAAAGPVIADLERQGLRSTAARERNGAIEGVARALEAGVPDAAIMAVGGAAREHGRSMAQFDRAIRSMALLTRAGMPADRAAEVVRSSVEHGFSERDYGRLERTVSSMLRDGRSMDDVVSAAGREVREGRESGGQNDGRSNREPGSTRDMGGRGGRAR